MQNDVQSFISYFSSQIHVLKTEMYISALFEMRLSLLLIAFKSSFISAGLNAEFVDVLQKELYTVKQI